MRSVNELFDLIGKNMKVIRSEIIKKSQEKVAEDTDLSRSFISQVESPNVDMGVSIDTLFNIAQTYNFDIREFFNGYENLMKIKERDE